MKLPAIALMYCSVVMLPTPFPIALHKVNIIISGRIVKGPADPKEEPGGDREAPDDSLTERASQRIPADCAAAFRA